MIQLVMRHIPVLHREWGGGGGGGGGGHWDHPPMVVY